MGQYWQKLIILVVALGASNAEPGWSNSPPVQAPIYSEAFCLKIFEEVAEKARSSSWQISDRDRHILTQCRTKFPPITNSQIPLPTADKCVYIVKTLVEGGLSKVKEIELPEEQVRSISRCDEVIKYYPLSADNMLPTLKPQDRIIVDKLVYQTQTPQRGDIIVFSLATTPVEKSPEPLTQRVIGLPREKVKINSGKVYINGKLLREDYITQSTNWYESIVVPANNYFVLNDHRNTATERRIWSLVPREAIVGKVIWHFGSK